jgi:hypothetical protein
MYVKKRIKLCILLSVLFLHITPYRSFGARPDTNPFEAVKTYYEINSDVDLKGKTLRLPKNATVSFLGGAISNGAIVCDNNRFEGYEGIAKTVSLSGTVKGPLNLSVFQLKENDRSFDMGAYLNMASSVCKSIIVPDGTYYFSSAIVLNDMRYYQQIGDLYYNGKSTDVIAVQFNGGGSSVIDIIGRVYYDLQNKTINYTKARKTNIIGIEFVNYNNSDVRISDVAYFNNNIRVSAYGAGTSYNKFTIGLSAYSNEHLRIYQKNKPASQIGWCNENIFYGGRFCNWSHFDWKNCESVAIKIEGAGEGDTYNSANSLLFIKPCMEGFRGPAIYAKNVVGCHWLDARTEDSQTFIKFVGDCHYNQANSLYGTEKVDYMETTTYPLILKDMVQVYSYIGSNEKILELNTEEANLFKVVFNSPEAKARVGIQYLTVGNGKTISKAGQKSYMRPRSTSHPQSFYYNKNTDQWKLASDSSESVFDIPEDVTRIRLTFSGKYSGVTVYANKSIKVTEQDK